MNYSKTRNMALVALFAALTAIGAFIRIEIPFVPFTLQPFFMALAGILLGSRLGGLSQLVYLLVGLAGMPVFTKGGGPAYVFQPTFGYLIGYVFAAYIIGKITEKYRDLNFIKVFFATVVGLFLVYLIGVPYLYLISKYYLNDPKTVEWAVVNGFVIFVAKDLFLCGIIALNAPKILSILRKTGLVSDLKT